MKIDFHVHTSHSYDASGTPREMVEQAIALGLDAICITDHDSVSGALEAMDFARRGSLLVIPGIEVKSREGHILGINVTKLVPSGLSFRDTARLIRQAGGLAVLAHPFRWPHHFRALAELDFREVRDLIDGVEIMNASAFRYANKKARQFVRRYALPFTAGSDAHSTDFLGKTFLDIPKDSLDIEAVVHELKNHGSIRVGGGEMKIHEKLNSAKGLFREKWMGERGGAASFLKSRLDRIKPRIKNFWR